MKFKKILLSLALTIGLFIIGGATSVNASSLPSSYYGKWTGNDYTMFIYPHSASLWYDGQLDGREYGFKRIKHGYYFAGSIKDTIQAEPIKLIHRNTLKSGDSGFSFMYLHRYIKRSNRRHNTHHHVIKDVLDDRKYSKGHFKRTNNKKLLKRSGFHLDSLWHSLTPGIYSNYPPYSSKAYIPKWIKIRNPRGGTLSWNMNHSDNEYAYDGHNTWECVSGTEYSN